MWSDVIPQDVQALGAELAKRAACEREAGRTADERSAIRKIVDADFYGYDPFSCWRTYTVSDAAVHEIYRILVECGAIKTSTEEGKPDGKSAE
jgi:hypothetical protein